MKVSVIIPNYNHSSYLKQRIDSVLNQTYQDFEVILLDDCSTDNSLEILRIYKTHPKVSVLYLNLVNSGSPFGLWKKGFELAKGELIWIAESDDWSEPTFLEKMLPCFINSDIVLAHCKSYLVTLDSSVNQFNYSKTMCYTFNPDEVEVDFVIDGKTLLESISSYRGSVVNVSSAIFRRDILSDIDIPSKYKIFGDWWFWSQLFLKGHICFNSEYLNYIRSHNSSATSREKSNYSRKYLENIEVAHRVSVLSERGLAYDPRYSWMIEFWSKEFRKTVNKFDVFFLPFLYLPFSFKVEFLKKIYFMYRSRIFPFLN